MMATTHTVHYKSFRRPQLISSAHQNSELRTRPTNGTLILQSANEDVAVLWVCGQAASGTRRARRRAAAKAASRAAKRTRRAPDARTRRASRRPSSTHGSRSPNSCAPPPARACGGSHSNCELISFISFTSARLRALRVLLTIARVSRLRLLQLDSKQTANPRPPERFLLDLVLIPCLSADLQRCLDILQTPDS